MNFERVMLGKRTAASEAPLENRPAAVQVEIALVGSEEAGAVRCHISTSGYFGLTVCAVVDARQVCTAAHHQAVELAAEGHRLISGAAAGMVWVEEAVAEVDHWVLA